MVENLLRDYPEVVFKAIQDSTKLKEMLYEELFLGDSMEEAIKEAEKEEEEKTIEEIVTKKLKEMGIPAHIKGYNYSRYAICLAIENQNIVEAITKELYPTVAKKFKTTSSRVERAIRHAIEVAWSRGKIDILENIFGYTVDAKKGKPTNSEFIALMADEIRMQIKRD